MEIVGPDVSRHAIAGRFPKQHNISFPRSLSQKTGASDGCMEALHLAIHELGMKKMTPAKNPAERTVSANSPPCLRIELARSSAQTPEFQPLLPPRSLLVETAGNLPRLLDLASLDLEIDLAAGSHEIPLFEDLSIRLQVAPGTCCSLKVLANRTGEIPAAGRNGAPGSRGEEAGPGIAAPKPGPSHTSSRLRQLEIQFSSPLLMEDVPPILARIPLLFEGTDSMAALDWLERIPAAAAARLQLGNALESLRDWLEPLGLDLAGGTGAKPLLWSLVKAAASELGELARVHLASVTARPVEIGGTGAVNLLFSGEVEFFKSLRVPFKKLLLPYGILPPLHGDLHKLLSDSPLAVGRLAPLPVRLETLADALAGLVSRVHGNVELAGRSPELELGAVLPDQGHLEVAVKAPEWIHLRSGLEIRLSPEALEIFSKDARLWADGHISRFGFKASVQRMEPGARGGLGIVGRLAWGLLASDFRGTGLSVSWAGSMEPNSRLPDLAFAGTVRHTQLLGGLDIAGKIRQAVIAGKGKGRIELGKKMTAGQRLEASFNCMAELAGGTQFSDGALMLKPKNLLVTLEGRVTASDETPVRFEITGKATGALEGFRPVPAIPELDIDKGKLLLHLGGQAAFGLVGALTLDGGKRPTLDCSGSRLSLVLQRASFALGSRRLLVPVPARLDLRLAEGILAASGLGRAKIDISWDLHGRSPLLEHGDRSLEIFVPELRQGKFLMELSPAGGLEVKGEDGHLYDGRFFNALVNPGADPHRLAEILANEEAMSRVLGAVELFSADAHRLGRALFDLSKRIRKTVEREKIERPGDAIPGPKLARLLSGFLVDSAELAEPLYQLIKEVTDGNGLDVFATKQLLYKALGTHDYEFEVDRLVRWLSHLLAPTEPLPPLEVTQSPPLEQLPEFASDLEEIPSAADINRALESREPLPGDFRLIVTRLAPCLALEQVDFILRAETKNWHPAQRIRLEHVRQLKRQIKEISESYGGLAFAPQALAIAFFLGETLAAERQEAQASILGPADVAVLLQAGLASVFRGRTVQLNQKMLLDHILSRPRDYLLAVLVEISGNSVRVLASVLNALLNMPQPCLRAPLDLIS